MKKLIFPITLAALFLTGCGSDEKAREQAGAAPTLQELIADKSVTHGKLITSVEVATPLNQQWLTNSAWSCSSCRSSA